MKMLGDIHGITAASAGRCVHDVSTAFASKTNHSIKWPDEEEIKMSKRKFYDYSNGFPCIMGAIDGTHVPLNAPHAPSNEAAYLNRKFYHSINCQILCNPDLKIFDIDCRWPGSSHDSFILKNSNVFRQFTCNSNPALEHTFILGDSGYALSKWLMVPISNPTSRSEERYNAAHKKARSVVERCNGVLKMRWRCLTKPIMFQPAKASKIIGACAALHNYAIDKSLFIDDEIDQILMDHSDMGEHAPEMPSPDGTRVRRNIVQRIFS